MRPNPQNYTVYPSVVLSDCDTELKILATEAAFLPFENEEYVISFVSVNSDEIEYEGSGARREKTTVTARSGVISLSHTFSGEGEHIMFVYRNEVQIAELHIYALADDLYALTPLKGDLHSHSYRSDGRRDPAALAGHYREAGYDFFALTDHNRFYPGIEIDEMYSGVYTGFCRVHGEEVHTPGSMVHIVYVGGSHSVAEQYIADEEGFERVITEDYEPRVPENVPAHLRRRYAKAMWACDRIHEAGGLAIFPHPYWVPGESRKYDVYDEFAFLLLESGMFDAYELIGAMGQANVNLSVALWGEIRAKGINIPVVGSSDVHVLTSADHFGDHFGIVFAEANENDAIINAVKNGQSVAVEADGEEYGRRYRAYGSLRLVRYAHFLLKYYFPQQQRLATSEGVAMRAYCIGESDASLIEAQAKAVDDYRARFFGRLEPVLPSVSLLTFEDEKRTRHLKGPNTKGSHIHSAKPRQI